MTTDSNPQPFQPEQASDNAPSNTNHVAPEEQVAQAPRSLASQQAWPATPPTAQPERKRNGRWLPWLIPVTALIAVVGLMVWYNSDRGPSLTITFADAHGLTTGAALRYRGMEVGMVTQVEPDDDSVAVTVALRRDATFLARSGSRFWIVRPELGITQVTGLDTVIGARYLAVRPGSGAVTYDFHGLEQRPLRSPSFEGGTEFVLAAQARGGLTPGAPVFFRQCEVGQVLAVHLARDASAVEIRIVIATDYAGLAQADTRFFRQGGIRVDAGLLSGVQIGIDSVAALIRGGISFATPPGGDQPAAAGHRFTLADGPEEDWLAWSPSLRFGAQPFTTNDQQRPISLPMPKRASIAWTRGRSVTKWWSKRVTRTAWFIPTQAGLLGPWQVLGELHADNRSDFALEMDGQRFPLQVDQVQDLGGGLGLIRQLDGGIDHALLPPPVLARAAAGIENVFAVSNTAEPLLIAAARLRLQEEIWIIENGIVPELGWHGAPVVAESDGKVIGILVVDDDAEARILPFASHIVTTFAKNG